MQYEVDRPGDTAGEPSLADMVVKAIQILEKSEDGFYLYVEGNLIDYPRFIYIDDLSDIGSNSRNNVNQ